MISKQPLCQSALEIACNSVEGIDFILYTSKALTFRAKLLADVMNESNIKILPAIDPELGDTEWFIFNQYGKYFSKGDGSIN